MVVAALKMIAMKYWVPTLHDASNPPLYFLPVPATKDVADPCATRVNVDPFEL
jgi:hypothetical protein